MKTLVVTAICAFIVALCLFLFLIYPEVRINHDYIERNCTVIKVGLGAHNCCRTVCSGCQTCSSGAPSCGTLENLETEGECCNGRYCCSECCDTCCTTDSKGKESCTQCRCDCCSDTSDRECQVVCPTCYTPFVDVKYMPKKEDTYHYAQVKKECHEDKKCATDFTAGYREGKMVRCYYDPVDFDAVVLQRGYTWWYFLIFSFPCLIMIGITIYKICNRGELPWRDAKKNILDKLRGI